MQKLIPSPIEIRAARADNPKMRERDLATQLGISEAQFVAAWCGETVTRVDVDMDHVFGGLESVGEVMALTRNRSAVHEKIGVFDNYYSSKRAAMMLGDNIDTRMFPQHFVHAFWVCKPSDEGDKHSLQFFDVHGDAVHKIHLRQASDLEAWHALLEPLVSTNQNQTVDCMPVEDEQLQPDDPAKVGEALRARWQKMTDTHQFVPIIRKLKLSRLQAVRMIGEDFAWPVLPDAVGAMMRLCANETLPIMCFVGSRGCIQIHSGPIEKIVPMGPWLNVMDPTFHLHLRMDRIAESWVVRKPTDKGHVTSVEAYDSDGHLIIQFFGKRIEGQDERTGWRLIAENLPRENRHEAA